MKPPVYVAFQGGGVLGMAHLGAWRHIAEHFTIAGVAGTSAGSIVAALCAAAYRPTEVIPIFQALDWREYVARQSLFRLLWKLNAWSSGRRFEQWISERLVAHFHDLAPQQASFAELFQRTKIYLAIVACDLNHPRPEPVIFTKDNEPRTLVSFAVRASIAIPGYFDVVPRRSLGQVLVDGGVLLNLPARPLLAPAQQQSAPLIGVRFTQPWTYLDDPRIWQTLGRTKDILLAAGSLPGTELLEDPHYVDVAIDVAGFSSLDWTLSRAQKDELVRRGAQAAELALLRAKERLPILKAAPDQPLAPPVPASKQDAPPDAPAPQRAAERPVAPAAPRAAQIADDDVDPVVTLLFDCASMKDEAGRAGVFERLPQRIQQRIRYSARSDLHVSNIVRMAMAYEHGIEQLIAAVRFFDDGSIAFQRLEDWWRSRYG